MQEEEQEVKEGGVTFGEIVRVVLKKIWYVLGASALCTIIAVLLVHFVINPGAVTYATTFTVQYPNRETLQYPDGTEFNYQDFISEEFLLAAKQSDEKFADLDVEGMIAKDAFSVGIASLEKVQDGEKLEDTGTYTISVKGGKFESKQLASQYLRAVGEQIILRVNESVAKFDNGVNLTAYENARTFSEKIDRLVAQKDYLLSRYDNFITAYGENYEVTLAQTGRTIRSYRSEVELAMDSLTEQVLRSDLANNGYRGPTEGEDLVRITIQELKEERSENRRIIAALQSRLDDLYTIYKADSSSSSTLVPQFEAFHTQIATLTTRNEQINTELIIRYASIGQDYRYDAVTDTEELSELTEERGDQAAFEKRLKEQYDLLAELTETYHSVAVKLYATESQVRFTTMQAVTESAGVSVALVAVATFVVVFLLGSVVVYAVDCSKRNKAASQPPQDTEGPEA